MADKPVIDHGQELATPEGQARAELVEDQATRAYFRRYGDSAQQPNRKATKVFEQDRKHHIRLFSVNVR